MEQINPGDIRTVRVAFSTVAGLVTTPADPTTVSLKWWPHGVAETTWVFGSDGQVVKDGTGEYHADIPIALPGLHYYEWVGTGVAAAVEQGYFTATTYRRDAT